MKYLPCSYTGPKTTSPGTATHPTLHHERCRKTIDLRLLMVILAPWSAESSLYPFTRTTTSTTPLLLLWIIIPTMAEGCVANALVPSSWWSSSFSSQPALRKQCWQRHRRTLLQHQHHRFRHPPHPTFPIRAPPSATTAPPPTLVPSSLQHHRRSITFRWFGCRQTLCSSIRHTKMFQFYIFAFPRIPERRCLALRLTRSPEVPFVSIQIFLSIIYNTIYMYIHWWPDCGKQST